MGKGTIISGGSTGLYQVQIDYDRTRYDAKLARLQVSRTATVLAAAAEPDQLKKDLIELQVTSIDLAISYLTDNMIADTTVAAWCADLTEDLSGIVGTIEVPGELGALQIQPGYDGNAVYNAARDGQVMPTISMNAPQAFYNLAMLPGWQKWQPLSRYATITGVSEDTASVILDTGTSSQQDLVINQTATLSGVPIEYMDCNGGAFEIGDEVLILFTDQDWGTPRIVGFKDNPKPCGRLILVKFKMLTGSGDHTECCIVWDLDEDAMATGILDNGGDPATFPIETSDVSDWIDNRSPVGTDAVSISDDPTGDAVAHIGIPEPESGDCTIIDDESEHGCTAVDPCAHCEKTVNDSVAVSGIDYEGNDGHSAFRTGAKEYKTNRYGTAFYEEIQTYDTPVRGKNVENKSMTSNTGQGDTRGRTAGVEITKTKSIYSCTNASDWPCDVMVDPECPTNSPFRDRIETTYEYEFKSPFSDLSVKTDDHVSGSFVGDTCGCNVHTDAEGFADQLYDVGSVMHADRMVVFYVEQTITEHNEGACAEGALIECVWCHPVSGELGECPTSCPGQDFVATYWAGVEFNIKAFSHVIPDESEDTLDDINPFEIVEDSGLSTALADLKDYAEGFSGPPGDGRCPDIAYSIRVV